MISDKDRKAIAEILFRADQPVTLVYFTQTFECDTCSDTSQLLRELAEISDKLKVEVWNFVTDKEKVTEYGVDKVPAIVLVGDRDRKIRYYGIPAGYEFASLLEDILMVSARDSGLSPQTRRKLASLTTPVHLEVLVTPT